MKRSALVILAATGAIALAAWQLAPADGHGDPVSTTPKADVAPVAAGYTLHLDNSGRIMEEPTPADAAELAAALGRTINTSSEGLVERPSQVAGGGTMVDLQGRFQDAATATIDATGHVTVPCLTNEADVKAFTSSTDADTPGEKE